MCAKRDVKVLARVVDYGGIFYDDLLAAGQLRDGDHRAFRPTAGSTPAGGDRADAPDRRGHGLTLLQLACQWTLAQPPVASVAPTLIQERGGDVRTVESKRAELAARPAGLVLTPAEVAEIAAIGDNTGTMKLKGGSPTHEGGERPDAWPLDDDLRAIAATWGIDPERDLVLR